MLRFVRGNQKQASSALALNRSMERDRCDIFAPYKSQAGAMPRIFFKDGAVEDGGDPYTTDNSFLGCPNFEVEIETTVFDPFRTGSFQVCGLFYTADLDCPAWSGRGITELDSLSVDVALLNKTEPTAPERLRNEPERLVVRDSERMLIRIDGVRKLVDLKVAPFSVRTQGEEFPLSDLVDVNDLGSQGKELTPATNHAPTFYEFNLELLSKFMFFQFPLPVECASDGYTQSPNFESHRTHAAEPLFSSLLEMKQVHSAINLTLAVPLISRCFDNLMVVVEGNAPAIR